MSEVMMNIFKEEAPYTGKGTTEEKILEAATREFTKHGLKGARMQAIADTAGVNKALLHYYFRSKQLLFEKVFQMIANKFFRKLRKEMEKLPKRSALKELLEVFIRAHINTIRANPFFPRLIAPNIFKFFNYFENIPPKVAKANADVINKILDTLQDEIQSGRIRPIHPIHFFMNILGMSIASFIGQPIVNAVYKNLPIEPLAFDDAFYEERICLITEITYNGLKLPKGKRK
jgi:AcrR family transcriptional regulator